jgi:hypothetical protein
MLTVLDVLLTVLSVPDCPNIEVLVDRLRDVLAGRPVDLEIVVVNDDDQARGWGMTGSPTLLIDGHDPFAVLGTQPSVSCRLYRGADCAVGGAPSAADLRTALGAAPQPARPPAHSLDALTRAGQGRRAPAEGCLRAVQQAVLRAAAATGNPPPPTALDTLAATCGRRGADVLRDLAAADFLSLDATGGIHAAYPFSLSPSPHRVHLDSTAATWAMCAVDALGIAAMLGRPVTVDSADPVTGNPIRVHAGVDTVHAQPATTVVFIGQRPGTGPAERLCCDAINFFASRHSATRWAATHPHLSGEIIDLGTAHNLGRSVLGEILNDHG